MPKSRFVLIALGLVALGSLGALTCAGVDTRPNVLLISIDMLRADHVSAYGYPRLTTPFVDRLAREGALFEEHISSSSWTLPGHASIFTAMPDAIHGATDTDRALGPAVVTLAERFRAADYETAGFFAGPYLHPTFGFGQGFDRYENCASNAKELDEQASSAWSMDPKVMRDSHEDVTNPRVLERFTRWFQRRSERPFFAFVHLWDAHFDFVPPPPWDTQFDPDYSGPVDGRGFWFDERIGKDMPKRDLEHLIALYDGEIAWTDEHVSRLCALLAEKGLLDDTIVVITSDHGTEFFEHGRKGHRQSLYDEVLHVPFVVRYPKRVPAGVRIPTQTRSIDVLPTLLDLAGLGAVADVQGRSLVPLLRPEGTLAPQRSISELDTVGIRLRAVRTSEWKFIDRIDAGDPFWFDLAGDPKERTPLSDLASPLGSQTSGAYLEEVHALNQWIDRHPPTYVTPTIPRHVLDDLKRNGYVGGDEDAGTGAEPRK